MVLIERRTFFPSSGTGYVSHLTTGRLDDRALLSLSSIRLSLYPGADISGVDIPPLPLNLTIGETGEKTRVIWTNINKGLVHQIRGFFINCHSYVSFKFLTKSVRVKEIHLFAKSHEVSDGLRPRAGLLSVDEVSVEASDVELS